MITRKESPSAGVNPGAVAIDNVPPSIAPPPSARRSNPAPGIFRAIWIDKLPPACW